MLDISAAEQRSARLQAAAGIGGQQVALASDSSRSTSASSKMEGYVKKSVGDAFIILRYVCACVFWAAVFFLQYISSPKDLISFVATDSLTPFLLLDPVHLQSESLIEPSNIQIHLFIAALIFVLVFGVEPDIGIPAANLLVRAAEAALPKQKKTLASSEFKHSVVAQRRRGKVHQVEGFIDLPQDILLHAFRFLDIRSLVIASSVCWSWNTAAKDNMLWMSHYYVIFGRIDISIGKKSLFSDFVHINGLYKGKELPINFDWRGAFKRIFTKQSVWRCRPHRAFCIHCESVLWLNAITCGTPHRCPGNEKGSLPVFLPSLLFLLLHKTDPVASVLFFGVDVADDGVELLHRALMGPVSGLTNFLKAAVAAEELWLVVAKEAGAGGGRL
ncbi:hypothetical protein KSP39_PZI007534 [Platanthera zijinensis]|uniref:F-box domain-containing protein n=1 Tax=Platanthera zijinensis TaxID=2320716 RepID=A0AAP0G8E0_9ASPA